MSNLQISLLGPWQMRLAGQPVTHFPTAKAQALLVYLAVEAHTPHTRDALIGLFWADYRADSARQNLRKTLYRLRQMFPPDYFLTNNQTVQFDPASDYSLDVTRFTRLVAATYQHRHADRLACDACSKQLQQAVDLYRGDFLDHFFVEGCPVFEEWVLAKREWLRHEALHTLQQLAASAEAQGGYDQAYTYAWRQVELDPVNEEAHQQLMRALALNGQRSAALAQYDTCRHILASELAVEPTQGTRKLYEQIRSNTFALPPVFTKPILRTAGQTEEMGPRMATNDGHTPLATSQSISLISRPHPIHARATDPTAPAANPRQEQPPPFMAPNLPPQGILGREEVLTHLFHLLQLHESAATNVPPVALYGMGGIGKTTLAIALSHLEVVSNLFPDGVLWASVGPQPTLRHWLESWGRALGLNLVAERDEAACCNRLRSVLHARRMLLLIDDVWEEGHGQSFLIAGPHCRTIFTTREPPVAFALATRQRTLPINLLNPPAALALLARLAPEVVATNQQGARLLCERLEYLPLALTLAGKCLAVEAEIPARMERLLSELIERRERRLQLLQTEGRPGLDTEHPVSLQAVLGLSVERLNQVDQERFAILAVFGGEPLTWESQAAAYVWECAVGEAEATIAHFIQRGLVMRRGESYWMHALLADYAAEMLAAMQ